MEQKTQQLEQAVATLKIRLFDAQEQIAFLDGQIKEREKALMKIVELVQVQPDENGTVSFDAIVDAVRVLVATDEQVSDAEIVSE